jgi:hypothetical protein
VSVRAPSTPRLPLNAFASPLVLVLVARTLLGAMDEWRITADVSGRGVGAVVVSGDQHPTGGGAGLYGAGEAFGQGGPVCLDRR